MISYELILSSAILIIIILTGSFNFTTIIENQQAIWYIIPLFPVFIFYFISILAETSRTPFDLQEARPNYKNDLASINIAICWNILKL
jgi:NADH-ubiquinone oxidoreductase chain 1